MAYRAIAIDSTYSAPYQLLGDWFARDDFYALSQDNATAAAYYTRYLSLEPDDVDAVTKLGAVLLRMEDQQAIARQIFKKSRCFYIGFLIFGTVFRAFVYHLCT